MSHINPVTGAFGASFSGELVRSSEELISSTIARIDSVVDETRDLTRMLGDHDRRIKMLERKVISKNGMLTSTSMHPDSASNNMELLIEDETKCEQYNLKQEVFITGSKICLLGPGCFVFERLALQKTVKTRPIKRGALAFLRLCRISTRLANPSFWLSPYIQHFLSFIG